MPWRSPQSAPVDDQTGAVRLADETARRPQHSGLGGGFVRHAPEARPVLAMGDDTATDVSATELPATETTTDDGPSDGERSAARWGRGGRPRKAQQGRPPMSPSVGEVGARPELGVARKHRPTRCGRALRRADLYDDGCRRRTYGLGNTHVALGRPSGPERDGCSGPDGGDIHPPPACRTRRPMPSAVPADCDVS